MLQINDNCPNCYFPIVELSIEGDVYHIKHIEYYTSPEDNHLTKHQYIVECWVEIEKADEVMNITIQHRNLCIQFDEMYIQFDKINSELNRLNCSRKTYFDNAHNKVK